MEARLGSDFSDVRVHTGDKAARSVAAVSATAYTVGSEVVFGQGSFDPASPAGRHRLAHELVHVQQQRQGPVSGIDRGGGVAISDPADSFEREAEATAARVASGPPPEAPGDLRGHHPGRPSVQLTGGRSVQRCGGMPCDCAADEQDSVQGGSTGAPALQPVQRATLAQSDAAPHHDHILPKLGTTTQPTAVQRQQDQTVPTPDAATIPAGDPACTGDCTPLAGVGDCTADFGKLNHPIFLLDDDVTPEPKLNAVYNADPHSDYGERLVLGTIDTAPNGPVGRVQTALICTGYGAGVRADGKYGPATNAALHCLKCEHNLQPSYFDDVGPKTMHCLNKLAWDSGCELPAPVTDAAKIAQAQNVRALNLTIARGVLDSMIGAPAGTWATGFPDQVAIVKHWLNADPTDPGYVATLSRARDLISQNADRTLPIITRGDGECAKGNIIGHFPGNSIHLCDCWFDNQNAACRVDVLTHETYHALGLHDGALNPFDNPNTMTQLVNDLDKLSTNNCTSC